MCGTLTDALEQRPDKMKNKIENVTKDLGKLIDAMKVTMGKITVGGVSDDTTDNENEGRKKTTT
jgi:hypothetical protein